MPANFSNQFDDNRKPEDLIKQRSVNTHMRYYKKLKIYCAMNDLNMVDVMDQCIDHALQDGVIEDLTK